jgi:hypothetical protein
MNTTIRYTTELGKEITFQEIDALDGYFKIFYDNNQRTKKEYYINGKLRNTCYIVKSESDIDSILINNPNASIEYSYNLSCYSITESRAYVHGVYIEKMASVFNSAGRLICFKKYKIIDNVLTAINTDKYYYDSNNEGKYQFIYNDDGTCFEVCDLQIDNADFYTWSIGVDTNVTFTWAGFEYYQNAEPLIPN